MKVACNHQSKALGGGPGCEFGEVSHSRSGFDVWNLRGQRLDWSRPYVMGILNITPDSFSDGGAHSGVEDALKTAKQMLADGADIIDVGGESTRPGAELVPEGEECRRVLPVIAAITRELGATVSVDTTKSFVASLAIDAGAEIINDISGGLFDERIISVVDQNDAFYICGHVRGQTMGEVHGADDPSFGEVEDELAGRLQKIPSAMLPRTMVDPCLGFGKSLGVNLSLLRSGDFLSETLSRPVLIGASRKRFVGDLCGQSVHERDPASVGAALAAVAAGAHMVRVHNVKMTVQAMNVFCAASGGGAA